MARRRLRPVSSPTTPASDVAPSILRMTFRVTRLKPVYSGRETATRCACRFVGAWPANWSVFVRSLADVFSSSRKQGGDGRSVS